MTAPIATAPKAVVYPESDGKPIADNTLQFEWIERIKGGLDVLFGDRDDVFVAADLLWYPVEGDNLTRTAPDALVAFGRPKGHRGSYLQFREENIAPQVVWEVLSPGNRAGEMSRKLEFYDRYGVEEYYVYDPDRLRITGWIRSEHGAALSPIVSMNGWVSPRLGVRFVAQPRQDLELFYPNGTPFRTYLEIAAERDAEMQRRFAEQVRRERAEAERAAEQQARLQAEAARDQAETARDQAETARDQAETARDAERAARERLEARLRALGIDPDSEE